MYLSRLRSGVAVVEERIRAAADRAGRSEPVSIVAITKGHPAVAVRAAIEVGLGRCGENRVGELEAKVGQIGGCEVEWHLVGHLQRNKVRRALPLFHLIQSIDSLRIARELSKEAGAAGVEVLGLVQVNTSGEEAKGGFEPARTLETVAEIAELPALRVQGLMTMAPLTDDVSVLRSTFAGARRLFERCGREVADFDAVYLSMGMSNDFEVAVEEGSTMVRLGTILFGERET